ncbi:TPA: hypothetical protein P4F65_004795 [Escherichia coli]|nr:hypothetical protein [Escherichia coli]
MLRSNIIDAASSVEDLIAKLGGTGRGLREKTNSISHLLEPRQPGGCKSWCGRI